MPILPRLRSERHRILIAALIGVLFGVLCFQYQVRFQRAAGDLPLCGAQKFIEGSDPYSCAHMMSTGKPGPSNPLTTILVVLPLVALPRTVAAGVFMGLSSAALAFGLTAQRQWWRLLIFLALPFWQAVLTVQWSPLFCAIALYPFLLPLALVKPQLGLPLLLTKLTPRRALGCALFGLLTLVLVPGWPLRWLPQISSYDGFIPLLTLPGVLLLGALRRWRQEHSRFLLLCAAVPQRLFYDQLLLFVLPQSLRGLLIQIVGSWLGFILSPTFGPSAVVACLYLPTLLYVLWPERFERRRRRASLDSAGRGA